MDRGRNKGDKKMKIRMQHLSRRLLVLAIAFGYDCASAQTDPAADRAAWARWIKDDLAPPGSAAKAPERMLPTSAPAATIEELKPRASAPAAAIPERTSAASAPAATPPERRSYPSVPGAPGLAPDRRINEQDCTKAVDFSAGNLRCK
jgi:hypothetical protein